MSHFCSIASGDAVLFTGVCLLLRALIRSNSFSSIFLGAESSATLREASGYSQDRFVGVLFDTWKREAGPQESDFFFLEGLLLLLRAVDPDSPGSTDLFRLRERDLLLVFRPPAPTVFAGAPLEDSSFLVVGAAEGVGCFGGGEAGVGEVAAANLFVFALVLLLLTAGVFEVVVAGGGAVLDASVLVGEEVAGAFAELIVETGDADFPVVVAAGACCCCC